MYEMGVNNEGARQKGGEREQYPVVRFSEFRDEVCLFEAALVRGSGRLHRGCEYECVAFGISDTVAT